MKRFLIMFAVVALTSCKSINFEPLKPLSKKLPNLGLIQPRSNSGAYGVTSSANAVTYGSGDFSFTNLEISTDFTKQKNNNKLIVHFHRRLVDETTESMGYIQVAILNQETNLTGLSYLTVALSYISLGTLNLVGFPFSYYESEATVEVTILDRKKRLVSRITKSASDKERVQLYAGYDEVDAINLSTMKALDKALLKVQAEINENHSDLLKKINME